jgi:hypothetical protein
MTSPSLIFIEGYSGYGDLAAEATWLGRALSELLLHDSRREALECRLTELGTVTGSHE